MFPKPRAAGTKLTLRHNGRTDVPPLITIDSFETNAALLGVLHAPVRLDGVEIDELAVSIPPGGFRQGRPETEDEPHRPHAERPSPILIERIDANSVRVEIHSRRPDRLPRVWDVQKLTMRDFGDLEGSASTPI